VSIVTCWILDHPAHLQLLSGFIRAGNENDLLVITQRPEIEQMIKSDLVSNYLPERDIIRVPRLAGKNVNFFNKIIRGIRRRSIVKKALKNRARKKSCRINRIVSIGAPIELRVGKKMNIEQRWYISDTEPNKIAHRLGMCCATDILVPNHWNEKYDGGYLNRSSSKNIRIHKYEGLHGHVHLNRQNRIINHSEQKKSILIRRIIGDGIHDNGEILEFDELLDKNKFDCEFRNENQPENANWDLPSKLINFDGVITQSVTLASEAAIQGVPTILISKAKRGFIDYLKKRCENFYRIDVISSFNEMDLNKLFDSRDEKYSNPNEWPDTKNQWIELLGPWKGVLNQ